MLLSTFNNHDTDIRINYCTYYTYTVDNYILLQLALESLDTIQLHRYPTILETDTAPSIDKLLRPFVAMSTVDKQTSKYITIHLHNYIYDTRMVPT